MGAGGREGACARRGADAGPSAAVSVLPQAAHEADDAQSAPSCSAPPILPASPSAPAPPRIAGAASLEAGRRARGAGAGQWGQSSRVNPTAALACPAPPPEDAAAASIIAGGGGENGGDDGGENGGDDGDDAPGAAHTPTAVTCGQQGVPA